MELNQIPQNPNNWGNVADLLNENSGKIEAETAKLNNVTTKFKGYFTTSTALSAKWPSPIVGDTAWVGATYPGVVYRCDVAGTWLATTDVPPSNTVNLSEYATQDAVSKEFASVRSDLSEIEINKLDKSSLSSLLDLDSETNAATSRAVKLINDKVEQVKDGGLEDGSIELPKLSTTLAAYIGSGGAVTNQADDDDLENTIINGVPVIREKTTKTYTPDTYSGMGRVILRKNIVNGINVLTQEMINQANTIYEIRYDFDLNGVEITIPEGCVLDFQGGSLNNGTIIYNTTLLSGTPFINSINRGVVKNTILYASWFNIKPSARLDNKHDNSVYINNIKEIIIGRTLQFENGVYYFSSSIIFEDGYLTIKGSCAEWSSNEEDPRHKGTIFRLNENFVGDYLFDIVASYWSGSTRSVNLSNFCIDCNSRAGGIKANLYDASIISNINIIRVPFNKEALFIGHPDGSDYAVSQTCLLQNVFTNDNLVSIDSIDYKPLIRIFGMQEGTLINVKAGTNKRIAAEFDNCTGCSIICCSFCSSSKEGGLSVKSCNSMSFLNTTFENTGKLVDFGASRIYLYWVAIDYNTIPQKGDYLIQYTDNEISFRGKVYLGGTGGANLEYCEGVFDNNKDIINETTGLIIGKASNSEYRYNDRIKIIAPRVIGTFNIDSSVYAPSYINYTRNSYLELIGETSENDPHSAIVDKNVEDSEIITHNIIDSINYSTSILSSSKFKQISLTNNSSESNAYTIVDGINELIIHGNHGQYFKAKLKNNYIDTYVFNVNSIITLKWDNNTKYYNYELIEGGFSSYSKRSIIDGKKYIHKNYDDTYIIAPRVGLFAYIQTNKNYFIYDDSVSYYIPIGSSYKIVNNSSIFTISLISSCSVLFEGNIYENVSSIKSNRAVIINKLSENIIEILGKDVELVYNGTLKINNFKSIPSTGRPNNPKAGYSYFDTTLNKPIWWTGSTWVDATGASI